MTVIPFRRPEQPKTPPARTRRSIGEFAVAMGLAGLAFFMLPTLFSGISTQLLTVIHLLIAAVYFQQGPRIAAGAWMALTLVVLVMTSAPSPVTYALWRAATALDAGIVAATPN